MHHRELLGDLDPEHRQLGALPPTSWIDDLMRYHGVPYYVGLLSAAAMHGAAHRIPGRRGLHPPAADRWTSADPVLLPPSDGPRCHREGQDETFRDSIKRRDTWFARFLLGKFYAETEHFLEAMAELDLCLKRRGEVADVFFYDTPSLRYLPQAYYWLARSQQAMGVADARANYEEFLALRGNADPPDPLASQARSRVTVAAP